MRLMNRARAFCSLPPGDQFRLGAAVCLLLVSWGGVFIISFSKVRWLLIRIGTFGEKITPGNPTAERVARTVDVADTHVPGNRTCLVRSLSVEALLRAYNYTFIHRIGINRTTDGHVQAHSWIEYDDKVLIGQLDELDTFQPLPPLDSREKTE